MPGPPPYLLPVQVLDPHEGEALLEIAGRERAGRLKANRIINACKADWSKMKFTYAKGR